MPGGTVFKFHDDLDTDQIIALQYLLLPNIDEMKVHTFESLDPDFPGKVKEGDYVVGGENFGCGGQSADGISDGELWQYVVGKTIWSTDVLYFTGYSLRFLL